MTWGNHEIGGEHARHHATSVYRRIQIRGGPAHAGVLLREIAEQLGLLGIVTAHRAPPGDRRKQEFFRSLLIGRTTRYTGYNISQGKRKMIELCLDGASSTAPCARRITGSRGPLKNA